MRKIAILFMLVVLNSIQVHSQPCESEFVTEMKRSYEKFKKKYVKLAYNELERQIDLSQDEIKKTFTFLPFPEVNYKKSTKRRKFVFVPEKFFCYLNPKDLILKHIILL